MNVPIDIVIDELVVAQEANSETIRTKVLDALTLQWPAQNSAYGVPLAMDARQLLERAADGVVSETRAHLHQHLAGESLGDKT